MGWRPSKNELELIADAGAARQPVDKIAAALGVTEEEFHAWAASLIATRSVPSSAPPPPRPVAPPPAPISPRVIADRMFEAADGAPGAGD
jgi:hypothetical protein